MQHVRLSQPPQMRGSVINPEEHTLSPCVATHFRDSCSKSQPLQQQMEVERFHHKYVSQMLASVPVTQPLQFSGTCTSVQSEPGEWLQASCLMVDKNSEGP